MKTKIYTEIFVLMLDGQILTPAVFKEYWKNYGNADGLYGWRPPKKMYYTLGAAKCGLHYVPEQVRDQVEIHRFASVGKIDLIEWKVKKAKAKLAEDTIVKYEHIVCTLIGDTEWVIHRRSLKKHKPYLGHIVNKKFLAAPENEASLSMGEAGELGRFMREYEI
jgi:hypothetical protein